LSAQYVIVLVTASCQEEAHKIADCLLQEKQAACINTLPGVKSAYWWQGKIESAEECLLIIKTKVSALDEVTRLVKSVHSYTVPEIIALPIVGGNEDYLGWIDAEVKEKK
jgi:periplasmic divalent cation tolerance protein